LVGVKGVDVDDDNSEDRLYYAYIQGNVTADDVVDAYDTGKVNVPTFEPPVDPNAAYFAIGDGDHGGFNPWTHPTGTHPEDDLKRIREARDRRALVQATS